MRPTCCSTCVGAAWELAPLDAALGSVVVVITMCTDRRRTEHLHTSTAWVRCGGKHDGTASVCGEEASTNGNSSPDATLHAHPAHRTTCMTLINFTCNGLLQKRPTCAESRTILDVILPSGVLSIVCDCGACWLKVLLMLPWQPTSTARWCFFVFDTDSPPGRHTFKTCILESRDNSQHGTLLPAYKRRN